VELVLLLMAISLTGGLSSRLYPLVLLDLVVALRFAGRGAAWLHVIGAAFGLTYLGSLSIHAPFSLDRPLVPGLGYALGPAALLAAIELGRGERRATGGRPAEAREIPIPVPARATAAPAPPASPPRPDLRQEILHDLKSPLSVLRVYADLIGEHTLRGELPAKNHVDSLGRELALMEAIVEVGGRGPAARAAEHVDLVAVLRSLTDSYRATHSDRRIEFEPSRSYIPVLADPVGLQRAFRNVLDNAIKYTPAAGQIQIRARVVSDEAFVVFSDTGVGMTEEEQERAFEYSYRGKKARESAANGRGLGLGLSRELIEANGGRISLSSRPDDGLEVTITLPVFQRDRQ
jgi:signal transduction histidine kinase